MMRALSAGTVWNVGRRRTHARRCRSARTPRGVLQIEECAASVTPALAFARSSRPETTLNISASGISASMAVATLTVLQKPLCAVRMSNHASQNSKALVVMEACTATCRCLCRVHAVVARQPRSMTSKPVQASGQLATR
jgi:hypothetical protein